MLSVILLEIGNSSVIETQRSGLPSHNYSQMRWGTDVSFQRKGFAHEVFLLAGKYSRILFNTPRIYDTLHVFKAMYLLIQRF